jgi:hypothetical protein
VPYIQLHSINAECYLVSTSSLVKEGSLIIVAICHHQLFTKMYKPDDHKKHFVESKYINRGLDFIYLSEILRKPEIQQIVPLYFDNIKMPILSYCFKISGMLSL